MFQSTSNFQTVRAQPKPPPFIHHGGKVEPTMTIQEGLAACGLNFEVKTAKCGYISDNGDGVKRFFPVGNNNVIYRTDNNRGLGIVSDKYTPISNGKLFGWIEGLVGKSDCCVVAGGQYDYGANVYLTLKFNEDIKIGGIDPIEKYVNIIGNHDGSGAVRIMLSPVRYFCQNQLSYSIKEAKRNNNLFTVRHNSAANKNFELVLESLNFINTKYTEIIECYSHLQKKLIDTKVLKQYLCRCVFSDAELINMISKYGESNVYELAFRNERHVMDDLGITPKKNKELRDIFEVYNTGFGQEVIQGTAWGAYNAITGYYNNELSFKTTEKRLSNSFGNNQTRLAKALDLALEIN